MIQSFSVAWQTRCYVLRHQLRVGNYPCLLIADTLTSDSQDYNIAGKLPATHAIPMCSFLPANHQRNLAAPRHRHRETLQMDPMSGPPRHPLHPGHRRAPPRPSHHPRQRRNHRPFLPDPQFHHDHLLTRRSPQQKSTPYPPVELEWLATTTFNRAVDFYCADEDEACRRWADRALDLATSYPDEGAFRRVLQEKYLALTWEK